MMNEKTDERVVEVPIEELERMLKWAAFGVSSARFSTLLLGKKEGSAASEVFVLVDKWRQKLKAIQQS